MHLGPYNCCKVQEKAKKRVKKMDLKPLIECYGKQGCKSLHLGCGRTKIPGTIGVDIRNFPEVNLMADLNNGLPFDSGSVGLIASNHVLEHLDYSKIMDEMLRVLMDGGINIIVVPHYSNHRAHMGEHRIPGFSWVAFEHFRDEKHPFHGFEIVKNEILFGKRLGFVAKAVNSSNRLKHFYERFFCGIFPASEILVVLRKNGKLLGKNGKLLGKNGRLSK